ncbi:MAG: anti-sigma factor antagonist [Actinophytocola sp.]|uniref:anti-sigma factor antagonist n=1 Tax=Actinophytocola sp. TaxID=1872138 RepID=UPI00132763E5|nr:anti-sigma factor antagonist [Actinophytocola sp.]MPZ86028.1 anti-sigma factor antagonist [Actinophytocola sp.]
MAEPLSLSRPRSRARRHWLTSPDTRLALRSYPPAPGVVVVCADGEIDLANRDALAAALSPAAADPATRLLVCDLSTTTFLACSGLSVLLDVKAELAERGARLRVVAADPTVLRVMYVTGQRDELDVHPELAVALAGLAPSTAPAPGSGLAELCAALDRAVEQTTELAATWGRLAERVSDLDATSLVDGRGGHWRPRETLADMAEDLRALQNHLATGALLAAPTVEDLGHLRDAPE